MTFAQIKTVLLNVIKEASTDVAGRYDIKNILGVPIVIASVVYGIVSKDWVGFAALFGGGTSLLTATAVADHKLDMKDPPYAT